MSEKKAVYQIRRLSQDSNAPTLPPNLFSLGFAPTARAAGRSSTMGHGDVSIEPIAPLPSTTPPAPLSIARTHPRRGSPRPLRTPPIAKSVPLGRGPARPLPTPPVARPSPAAAEHHAARSALHRHNARAAWPATTHLDSARPRGAARPVSTPPGRPPPPVAVASPAAAKPSHGGARAHRPKAEHAGRASRSTAGAPTRESLLRSKGFLALATPVHVFRRVPIPKLGALGGIHDELDGAVAEPRDDALQGPIARGDRLLDGR